MKYINDLPISFKFLFVIFLNFIIFVGLFEFIIISKIESFLINSYKKNLAEKVLIAKQISQSLYNNYKIGMISKPELVNQTIQILSEITPSKNEYYFIFDQNKRMIYHPDKSLIKTNVEEMKDINNKEFMKELLKQLENNDEAFIDYYWNKPGTFKSYPKITYAIKVPDLEWYIASGIYLDDIEVYLSAKRKDIYLNILISLIIISFIMFIIIYIITRKFKIAESILKNIQEGIFIIPEIKDYGNDEFAKILKSLITAIHKISEIFNEIIPIIIKLEESSIKLKTLSKRSRESLNVQHNNYQNISASIEESSISITEISKIVEETFQDSNKSLKMSEETSKVFNQTQNSVNNIFSLFDNIGSKIRELNQTTRSIEEIINIIKEIAEQTNLIALNASIEAAKTGEEGGRFNVIAEEIRKLSLNTKESAEKISENIKNSINYIDEVYNGILDLNKEVKVAQDNFSGLDKILNSFIASFQNINFRISQLSSSLEEINITSKEIARNMSETVQESQKVLETTMSTSNESKQLNQIVDILRQLTYKIKTMALEKFIFELAKTDHIVFINNIKDKIEEKIIIQESEIVEFTQCRFGKWYYGDDSKKYKNNEYFIKIEEPHKNVHNIGKEIARLTMQNQFRDAEELLKELDKEAEKVIQNLENLNKFL